MYIKLLLKESNNEILKWCDLSREKKKFIKKSDYKN